MLPNMELGSLKTTFGPNRANAKIILYVMPVFILVGLILIAPIPIGGAVMLLIAAGLFLGYRAQMRARVDVYDQGAAIVNWLGRSAAFRWNEVAAVYEFIGCANRGGMGFGRPTQWVYTVQTRDGRRIKLDMAFEKIRSLGSVVLAETAKIMLPVVQETLRAGGSVPFGEQIAVSGRGFVAGEETLPWTDVEKIQITHSADLCVRKKGQRFPWKLIMHGRIANFPIFRSVIHEIVKGTPAEGALDDPSFR